MTLLLTVIYIKFTCWWCPAPLLHLLVVFSEFSVKMIFFMHILSFFKQTKSCLHLYQLEDSALNPRQWNVYCVVFNTAFIFDHIPLRLSIAWDLLPSICFCVACSAKQLYCFILHRVLVSLISGLSLWGDVRETKRTDYQPMNTLRPEQKWATFYRWHFEYILWNENYCIMI